MSTAVICKLSIGREDYLHMKYQLYEFLWEVFLYKYKYKYKYFIIILKLYGDWHHVNLT